MCINKISFSFQFIREVLYQSYFRYHKQAVADVEAVWRRTLQLLRQLGKPSEAIPETDVKLYCRHASELSVQRGTSIAEEYDPKMINTNEIGKDFKITLVKTVIA